MTQKLKVGNRQDFFGLRGCCINCSETTKETMTGLRKDVYQSGKHYSCLCHERLCVTCSWTYIRDCQRKFFENNKLSVGGES